MTTTSRQRSDPFAWDDPFAWVDDPFEMADLCYHSGEQWEQVKLWEEFAMPEEHPPFWYQLVEGVTISEYPSDRWGNDPRRLEAALARGCTAFIDLTVPGEYSQGRPLQPYDQLLAQLGAQRGLDVASYRFAVRDLTVPSVAQMQRILDAIDAACAAGQGVLVHCLGGIGRSGTVAGCYLVRQGWTPDQALSHIQHQVQASVKRGRASPETPDQIALVRAWPTVEKQRRKEPVPSMDTATRVAITQAWVRRHTPPREHALLLAEVAEVARWSDDELAQVRRALLDDYFAAMGGRSDLFANLVSFEAWHRLTGYVLGQPMDAATAERTAWLWTYMPDLLAPYNPWMVEEQAMLATAGQHWDRLAQDWQSQCDSLHTVDDHWSATPTEDKAAFWQKLGTSPLFMKLFNTERW